jgi:uncharacterized membrane protein YczE
MIMASMSIRLGQLLGGTAIMGMGTALLVWSRCGMVPLDVLHVGIAKAFGWSLGWGIFAGQALLALTFLPLRLRPGLGTVAGLVVPPIVADLAFRQLPAEASLPLRITALALGGLVFCAGVACYLLSDLGRLPRDGLLVVYAGARHTIRKVSPRRLIIARITLDVTFIVAGVLLLGIDDALSTGALGPGTAVMVLTNGPLIAALVRFALYITRKDEYDTAPV